MTFAGLYIQTTSRVDFSNNTSGKLIYQIISSLKNGFLLICLKIYRLSRVFSREFLSQLGKNELIWDIIGVSRNRKQLQTELRKNSGLETENKASQHGLRRKQQQQQ